MPVRLSVPFRKICALAERASLLFRCCVHKWRACCDTLVSFGIFSAFPFAVPAKNFPYYFTSLHLYDISLLSISLSLVLRYRCESALCFDGAGLVVANMHMYVCLKKNCLFEWFYSKVDGKSIEDYQL